MLMSESGRLVQICFLESLAVMEQFKCNRSKHTILSAVVSDSMVQRRPGILEDFLKSTVVYVQEHVVFVNKCRRVLRVYLTAVRVISQ